MSDLEQIASVPRILPAEDTDEQRFRARQREIFDAYVAMARSIAEVTTEFHEKPYNPPVTPKFRLHFHQLIPPREGGPQTAGDSPIKELLRGKDESIVTRLHPNTKENIQHQVLHSIITGEKLALTGITEKERVDAESYAQYVRGKVEPTYRGLKKVMPKLVQKKADQIFRSADLHENFTDTYLYGLAHNRLMKPEFAANTPDNLENTRVIIPIRHYQELLLAKDAWWSAKYLHFQFRKLSDETRLKLGLDFVFAAAKRAMGFDPKRLTIDDNNAAEYAAFQFPFHHAPDLVPILEDIVAVTGKYSFDEEEDDAQRHTTMRKLLGDIDRYRKNEFGETGKLGHIKRYLSSRKYRILNGQYKLLQKQVTATEGSLALRYDEKLAAAMGKAKKRFGFKQFSGNESPLLEAIEENKSLAPHALRLEELVNAEKEKDPVERNTIRWMTQMFKEWHAASLLHKKTFVDPTVGWNADDDSTAEDNVRKGANVADRTHALLLRNQHGIYPVLDTELNKRATWFLYRLTHEAFLVGDAAVHELGKDAGTFLNKFSEFIPMSDDQRQRLQGYFSRRFGFEGARASVFERLREATYAKSDSVIRPNTYGAYAHDHWFVLAAGLGSIFARNLWDHAHAHRISTALGKIWGVMSSPKDNFIPFIEDLFTYRPGDAHKHAYGKIDANDDLSGVPEAFEFIAKSKLRTPSKEEAFAVYERLLDAHLTHKDNVYARYALGVFQREQDKNRDAEQWLLDTKGWIEGAKDEQLEDASEYDKASIRHQLLSAAEYQLADLYRERGHRQLAHKDLLISAYKRYTIYKTWVEEKAPGGELVVTRRVSRHLTFRDQDTRNTMRPLEALIDTPLDFKLRKQAIELLYENKRMREASELLVQTYNDLNEIASSSLDDGQSLLSQEDFMTALDINKVGSEHGMSMPEDLRVTLTGHRNRYMAARQAQSRYVELPRQAPRPALHAINGGKARYAAPVRRAVVPALQAQVVSAGTPQSKYELRFDDTM